MYLFTIHRGVNLEANGIGWADWAGLDLTLMGVLSKNTGGFADRPLTY